MPCAHRFAVGALALALAVTSFASSERYGRAFADDTLASPGAKDDVAVGPPVEDDLRHPKGHGFIVSSSFIASFRKTGPFVRTALLTGYSSMRGGVDLPCSASQLRPLPNGRPGEAAYAYVGGWGANTGAGQPRAVDAGFYHDVRANAYRLFMAYEKPHGWVSDSKSEEFACGQTVAFEFRPLSHTALSLSATGRDIAGATVTRKLTTVTQSGDGWWPEGDPHPRLTMPDGEGVLLKIMTTIAQTKGVVTAPDWATSGSYFGRTVASKTPEVVWRNLEVGRATVHGSSAESAWTWVPWSAQAGVPITDIWPDHTRAIISSGGSAIETAINLHPGKPALAK